MSRWPLALTLAALACKGDHEDGWTTPVESCDDYAYECSLEGACDACVGACGEDCVYRNTDEDSGMGRFICPDDDFVPGQHREACDTAVE